MIPPWTGSSRLGRESPLTGAFCVMILSGGSAASIRSQRCLMRGYIGMDQGICFVGLRVPVSPAQRIAEQPGRRGREPVEVRGGRESGSNGADHGKFQILARQIHIHGAVSVGGQQAFQQGQFIPDRFAAIVRKQPVIAQILLWKSGRNGAEAGPPG